MPANSDQYEAFSPEAIFFSTLYSNSAKAASISSGNVAIEAKAASF
jgi:hypothetical protein